MRAAGGVGPCSTDNGPELGSWWEAGGGGGRAVEWCGGVACYLAVHYEDVARKTQGN